MAITLRKPVEVKSKTKLPAVLEAFLDKSIESMDQQQLSAWREESAKIMRKAKRRVAAEKLASATHSDARPAARKMRRA